ncbi:MAG TPA: glutathione S-transferase family protein [Anaeromyxobacteraceae bacterium]|nr:glutathione S-transferase family protein [Anaeromyxobacteraceae bacterium]
MRLYFVPKTRAVRPRWVLEELGVPHELVRLDPRRGDTRTPDHLARHPLGRVPVLEDGATRIFESAAICLHLADRHPDARLAPLPGTPARALLYQWMFFGATEVEPPLGVLSGDRRRPEGQRNPGAVEAARPLAEAAARVVDSAVGEGPWLLGDSFTVGDVYLGSALMWAKLLGIGEGLRALDAWIGRLRERPAYQRATAD